MKKIEQSEKAQQVVIFIHIPKSGGVTLQRILEKQYTSDTIFTIQSKMFHESIERFKYLPESQHRAIRLLKGHMFFGLHEFLPIPCRYITILRNPVDRIISHYYYVLQNPTHYLYQDVVSQKMNLGDYVCSGLSPELDNCQTRLLSGVQESIGVGQCSFELLEKAKTNLKSHFAVVGLLERFNETMILFKKVFGWKMPFYIQRNKTKKAFSYQNISQKILNSIIKTNQLDIELYKYGEALFEKSILKQDKYFKAEVLAFSVLNKIYQTYRSFLCFR
ncbi:sulfotransferase family 2 domain-containing protein [Coleofasciculus chthonoplastes]|nr:sulfotransferase family 2 domain-containing protein [Coleofasciculus chthonoplastes]